MQTGKLLDTPCGHSAAFNSSHLVSRCSIEYSYGLNAAVRVTLEAYIHAVLRRTIETAKEYGCVPEESAETPLSLEGARRLPDRRRE
mmetsp:Transcript_12645/g.24608  ORF Transcript_12645/g.24608 Transcript_12645/m.24608 type:complete len:87 (+) Transcript_12645:95-355(+)